LRIAAASIFRPSARVDRAFRQDTRQARGPFGSSGNFLRNFRTAPVRPLLSADADYPKRLESSGLTVPGTLVEYGNGRLVLWTRNDTHLDLARGLAMLAEPGVRRIAIANPEYAPYGRAAVAALRHEGLYDRVRTKFVLGENISQAAQFAQSGNADAGLIALSLALAPTMRASGRYVDIPASYIRHGGPRGASILRQPDVARQFIAFLPPTTSGHCRRPASRSSAQS
jgi:molybdate transport system substrate-binding protein